LKAFNNGEAKLKYSEFLKLVQNRSVEPVVTFLGSERFLKERALEALVKQFIDEDTRAFNYRSLDAEDLKDSSFLDDASTLPMFGQWKVLYVKDAAALEKSFTRIKDYLEQYLKNPSSSTILVFDVAAWEGRSKLKGLLTKTTNVVEFNPLSEKEIPSWVTGHLRTLKYQIDPQAVSLLTERLGADLQKISAELEKLMLLRQSEKRITAGDVESTVGYSLTGNVWQWSDAIFKQDAAKAINLLDDLLESEEQPVYLVALLLKQYEKAILTKDMVAQRIPQATIAQKINKPVYYLQPYLDQLSAFQMKDLVKAIRILAFTDRALKTGQASSDRTILHLMTIQLCQLKAPVAPVFEVPLQ
jgi:DNA polymerase III subunit delta